ncbi:MAG: GrpB family protein [Altererythrobacter sp.]|nr:GrpB family protein [Altererythrobacter sp.]
MKANRPYSIETYDPEWKKKYEEVSKRISDILGESIISIEHIGSTSIEGMVAKPRVDVLVVVKDCSKIPALAAELEGAGFSYHGGGYIGHNPADEYVSENVSDGIRVAGIHILPEGNFEIADYRNFRDYLREHPTEKQRYMDIKKELFDTYPHDYEAYDSGKRALVLSILEKANEWASGQN